MNYSYSWTQPYDNWPQTDIKLIQELAVIEAIDHLVDSGLTHPMADAIIKSLINNSKE
jgi:hypothetical protein